MKKFNRLVVVAITLITAINLNANVEPLMQTSWKQGYLYNYYCPENSNMFDDEYKGKNGAGCDVTNNKIQL